MELIIVRVKVRVRVRVSVGVGFSFRVRVRVSDPLLILVSEIMTAFLCVLGVNFVRPRPLC
jgi:hypothetical protein